MARKTRRVAYMAGIAGLLLSCFLTSCSIISGLFSNIPGAPTGVASTTPAWNASANGGSGGYQMVISWNAVLNATSYNVYHTYGAPGNGNYPIELSGGGPGAYTYESNNTITGTSYTFVMGNADPAGYVFEFEVSAVNSNGEGILSSPANCYGAMILKHFQE